MAVFRSELKYLINTPSLRLIEKRLDRILSRDSHSVSSFYRITSLYFDDRTSKSYLDKINGIEKREKFRIRYYNGATDYLRLEKKAKIGSKSLKTGTRISYDTAMDLIGSRFDVIDESREPLDELRFRIRHQGYHPLLFVDYKRIAFLHPVGNVRITLDYDLYASRFHDQLVPNVFSYPVFDPGMSILEIKYDSFFPPFLNALLCDIPKQACAFSKFSQCRNQLF